MTEFGRLALAEKIFQFLKHSLPPEAPPAT